MNRLAVIDIGTHSILCLVAEINQQGEVIVVDQAVRTVRLGRGVGRRGVIQNESLQKAIEVLKEFNRMAADHHVDQTIAVGTRVFRAARNREQVCKTIRRETGLDVEVLSDQDEAQASYKGAVYGRFMDRPTLVVDIGGGSTEFICGRRNQIDELTSINLGAVYLTEKYIHHDPPLKKEIDMLISAVRETLNKKTRSFLKKEKRLIATGGTATTLAAIQLRLNQYDPDLVDGYIMSLGELENVIDQIVSIPLLQRQRLLRFDPARADIILAGSMLLKAVMLGGKFEDVTISDQGLRLGIALRAMS